MMMGSADGSDVPCSLSFMSFMAMENSNLSIFPSLFMSASVLTEKGRDNESRHSSKTVKFGGKPPGQKTLCVCMCVCACEHDFVSVTHHISANTEAGSPDCRKNFLACSPAQRNTKRRK